MRCHDVGLRCGLGALVGFGHYVAHMRITKVDGDDMEFDIKTQPRSP